ncbi:sulfotransferase family protein [Roseisalinus antarcticus]|uniref:Sulfotransferase domain protein n=1 Tax=Roseisalinus antarcticus TaxID=254357 RepID=A0A1Y5TSJ7_9RHOB|nr:sulfotransferase [Roseisalinus antarcticus]SLN69218.1 Sulfotransferase domain protein [Roseisalinus antarcticus]
MTSNLFLIAAPRSGSTQLSAWLGSHPDIGMPPIKEPNFFSQHEFPPAFVAETRLNDVIPERYVASRSKAEMQFAIFREPAQYDYLFEDLKTRWRLDASTTYLQCPEAPAAIAAHAPDARVILLTRDPVARALSHYRLAARIGQTTRSLREEIDAELRGETPLPGRFLLRPSRYDAALARYRQTFDDSRRLELTFEEMVADIEGTLARIAAFLGIPAAGFDQGLDRQNSGDAPRFRRLNVFLHRSGAKTVLRRLLPPSLKRRLKAVYFKPNTDSVDDGDTAYLRELLEVRA